MDYGKLTLGQMCGHPYSIYSFNVSLRLFWVCGEPIYFTMLKQLLFITLAYIY